jgi:hypothetical protein
MLKDLFIYVHAVVQEKGSEWRRGTPDSNEKPELELKIIDLKPLKEVRKLIKNLYISFPLQNLDREIVDQAIDMILKNGGDITLYVEVKDLFTMEKVSIFSRKHRVSINSALFKFLEEAQELEKLTYRIEMT